VVRGGQAAADAEAAKEALRDRVRVARRALSAADLAAAARGLADQVLALPELAAARRVAGYVSVGREPGTGPLLDALEERALEVVLPLVLPDLDLDWARYTGAGGLSRAARGLFEPTARPLGRDAVTSADVVLVPGLAVDRRGVRLGRGGGSYDRVLARLRPGTFTCVLLHDGEVLDLPVPRLPHDVPVRAAATPSGCTRFA
jgi:5-formyltetrahydrofolate cyclo-ligase